MATQKINDPRPPSHIKDLLLLFAVPIGIALFALAAVYGPSLLAKPKYDFIYSVCDDYSCRSSFAVDSAGQISEQETAPTYRSERSATLRYYNSNNDSSRSLTLEEAKTYQLNTSTKSPDGYSLLRDEGDGGFLFWGDYDRDWYLKKGAIRKKAELTNDNRYSRDINFLGWVNK